MRRTGFEPDPIYSALAYFQIVANGEDSPLYHPSESPSEDAARNVAYNKGGLVFSMLSRHIGVPRFQEAFHAFTSRYAHGQASWEEFLQAVRQASGEDLTQFFEQWFERTGAPDFSLSWSQEGDKVTGIVRQPAPYYLARAEVQAVGTNGETLTSIVDVAAAAETTFALRTGFPAHEVIFDPHYKILRWTPEYRALGPTKKQS